MNNNTQLLSIIDLADMKSRGQKITCLTAYDACFSAVLDKVGIDVILVGDSLAMVIQGQDSTLSATIEDMVYHTQCVVRGRSRAFVIADLPFMTYPKPDIAAENAARLIRESNAQMVKIEGGRKRAGTISYMVDQGIPVCGHLGLLPQSINLLGEYKVQGKDKEAADEIFEDAKIIQDAGADLLVLECVPADLAKKITESLSIPTIGIGAGVHCDGQVLVLYDMLGLGQGKQPKFSKDFMADAKDISSAISNFITEVRKQEFPSQHHSFA